MKFKWLKKAPKADDARWYWWRIKYPKFMGGGYSEPSAVQPFRLPARTFEYDNSFLWAGPIPEPDGEENTDAGG